ncbi:MAG: FtsX-like permease family protein [Akkermansiaceae bacterium]|jgi:putative ABC transport system permease protein|nr:FtsX-like permease family protein [Akkermansiaceae bacterium]
MSFSPLLRLFAVAAFNLLSLPQRKASALTAMTGIAGVAAVLVGVLAIASGFRKAMTVAGSPEVAIVMRSGADSEMTSNLERDAVRIIAEAPGVARGPDGPLSSGELFVILNLPKRSTGTDANVPLRGVEPAGAAVRGNLAITAGRMFQPGRNEVVVGRGAAGAFAGLDVGGTLDIGRESWNIVGEFAAEGGIAESEIWADATQLQASYQRESLYQAVYARLESADAFETFAAALAADPRLKIKAVRQTDYYAEQSELVTRFITTIGYLIASLMALGALFGALNTMYGAVAARAREIATLRALGFGAGPVVFSVMVESVLLALAGGLAGSAIAYLIFHGYQASTINWQTFSQVTFAFEVTPALLASALAFATAIGLLGGLFPALRAARQPVAAALRDG